MGLAGLSIMTTRLQLHLSAKNLKNMSGWGGMSDPFAIVTVRGDNENNRPRVVGQTDVYVPSYRCDILLVTLTLAWCCVSTVSVQLAYYFEFDSWF